LWLLSPHSPSCSPLSAWLSTLDPGRHCTNYTITRLQYNLHCAANWNCPSRPRKANASNDFHLINAHTPGGQLTFSCICSFSSLQCRQIGGTLTAEQRASLLTLPLTTPTQSPCDVVTVHAPTNRYHRSLHEKPHREREREKESHRAKASAAIIIY